MFTPQPERRPPPKPDPSIKPPARSLLGSLKRFVFWLFFLGTLFAASFVGGVWLAGRL